MNSKIRKTLFLFSAIIIVAFCVLHFNNVYAADSYGFGIFGTISKPVDSLSGEPGPILNTIFNTIITISEVAFIIMFFVGGVMYLTSMGDEEGSKKAKKLLLDAVIGIVIVLSAWAIGTWILTTLKGNSGSGTNPSPSPTLSWPDGSSPSPTSNPTGSPTASPTGSPTVSPSPNPETEGSSEPTQVQKDAYDVGYARGQEDWVKCKQYFGDKAGWCRLVNLAKYMQVSGLKNDWGTIDNINKENTNYNMLIVITKYNDLPEELPLKYKYSGYCFGITDTNNNYSKVYNDKWVMTGTLFGK